MSEQTVVRVFDSLSPRYRRFVDAYLETWSKTEAGRRLNYAHPAQQACRLFKKDKIQAAIRERMQEMAMGADEVLLRLRQMAGANINDFVNLDREGHIISIKEDALQERGFLVKKITSSEGLNSSSLGIELYDAQAALVQLGRCHALFTDKTDITSGREKIVVTLKGEDEKP